MEFKLPNKVIVIGGDHHNGLGIVRSLGQKGVDVYLIVMNKEKSFIAKSKYVSRCWCNKESDREVLEILTNNFNSEKFKPIIIPTSDKAANIVDRNFNLLSVKYLLPNIDNKEGQIVDTMNKEKMCQLASELGLLVPKTWTVDLNPKLISQDLLPPDIIYPCIIKPLQSIDGCRQDITVCEDVESANKALNFFLRLGYKEVLIQEFISKEMEIGLLGCVTKNSEEIIIPGTIKKLREFPIKSGSASFAIVDKEVNKIIDNNSVTKFLKKLRYYGIFDMEFIYSEGKLYFVEVNFRNGGNSYAITEAGVNLAYLWCLDIAGYSIEDQNKNVEKSLSFMMDTRDFRHVINRDLNLTKWIKDLLGTGAFLVFNIKDIKPFIYKFIYR